MAPSWRTTMPTVSFCSSYNYVISYLSSLCIPSASEFNNRDCSECRCTTAAQEFRAGTDRDDTGRVGCCTDNARTAPTAIPARSARCSFKERACKGTHADWRDAAPSTPSSRCYRARTRMGNRTFRPQSSRERTPITP